MTSYMTFLIELAFQHFRAILAGASSIAIWACAAWAGWLAHGVRPPAAALLALPVLYGINVAVFRLDRHGFRAVARSRLERAAHLGVRLWMGCSFGAIFSAATLATTAALWAVARVFLDTLAVQAGAGTLLPPETAAYDMQGMQHMQHTIDPLFRWLATAGMTAAALAIGYGYTVGQRRLEVTRLTLPVRGLPAELHGLRIVQISDVHIGPHLSAARLAGYVASINALEPDLICITGDIVDSRLTDLDPALPTLSALHARYGVVAILGNHDHHVGADAVAERLQRGTSFIVLRDSYLMITMGEARLRIIGIEERGGAVRRGSGEEQRFEALLAGVPPGEPVILLAHRPELFEAAATAGIALTLSGHTHGGQVAIRAGRDRHLSPADLMSRFTRGLFERDGAYLYVNRGLGVTGEPVRVGSPREIAVLELSTEGRAADVRAAGYPSDAEAEAEALPDRRFSAVISAGTAAA
jgi:predicted MPP superfamily phosphohydrolase